MPTNRETSKPNGSARTGYSATDGESGGAAGLFSGIQQKVSSRVDEHKNKAADGLGGIADVIRSASDELRLENETLASYVDMAGDQMRRLADEIRRRGVGDMMEDVGEFARRRPAVFIGGAFLLGIGLARFLKSSADNSYTRSYGDRFSSVDPMTAGTGSPSYSGDFGEAGNS